MEISQNPNKAKVQAPPHQIIAGFKFKNAIASSNLWASTK
jgi:hypothetical protein